MFSLAVEKSVNNQMWVQFGGVDNSWRKIPVAGENGKVDPTLIDGFGIGTATSGPTELNINKALYLNDPANQSIRFKTADTDYARIAGGTGADGQGYIEIAAGDNGTNPIYARQYYFIGDAGERNGPFTKIQHEAALLDASGNTKFPGTLDASGVSTNIVQDVVDQLVDSNNRAIIDPLVEQIFARMTSNTEIIDKWMLMVADSLLPVGTVVMSPTAPKARLTTWVQFGAGGISLSWQRTA